MDISFIIVNFRCLNHIKNCISSIDSFFSNSGYNYEIILVNNDTKKISNNYFDKKINIIENQNNIGFGSACNIGAKKSSGKILFFLNPDTIIKAFSPKILFDKFLDANLAIISPQLISSDNLVQKWSVGKKITPLDIILNNIGFCRSKKIWNSKKELSVDWVSGASLIIKKDIFNKIEGFDKNFFMYFEDIDLCRKIKLLNKKILFYPEFKVIHLEGKSSTNEKIKKTQYYVSQDYYFEKYYGKVISFFIKYTRKCLEIFF